MSEIRIIYRIKKDNILQAKFNQRFKQLTRQ